MFDLPLAAQPGDVLAQPTRARLFALLGELGRPASTVELADQLGLHVNGVRAHLERLAEAGLVMRERERLERGRPRDVWAVAPDARPAEQPPRAYTDLGRWLARAMRAPDRAVEETGREIGRELAPAGLGGARRTLPTTLSALGFQPRVEPRDPRRMRVTLQNCPYRDVVHENPDLVCALHRGITQGVLDEIEPHAQLSEFVPRDPYRAGCLIEITGLEAE